MNLGSLRDRLIISSNENLNSKSQATNNNNNNVNKLTNSNGLMASLSPRSNWQQDSDSGLTSQKSDSAVSSSSSSNGANNYEIKNLKNSSNNNNYNNKSRPVTRASSIPRPLSGGSSCSNSSNSSSGYNNSPRRDDLTFKNFSREELINYVHQILNENSIIKRQIECELYSFLINFIKQNI